jgi:hypothetical protein
VARCKRTASAGRTVNDCVDNPAVRGYYHRVMRANAPIDEHSDKNQFGSKDSAGCQYANAASYQMPIIVVVNADTTHKTDSECSSMRECVAALQCHRKPKGL